MLSFTVTRSHIPLRHQNPFSISQCTLVPSLILECKPKERGEIFKRGGALTGCLGFKARKLERYFDESWACWSDMSDDGVEMESEIMNFMANSKKPRMFPTKEELIVGGRMDLVEAITKVGGWYSFRWDEEHFDREDSLRNKMKDGFSTENDVNFQHLTTLEALEKPLETGVDYGIEGILSRLEKRRNQDFQVNMEGNTPKAHLKRKQDRKDSDFDASLSVARFDLGGNGKLTAEFKHKGALSIPDDKGGRDIEPESWRTWSSKRAGFQYKDFEAAENNFSKNRVETDREHYHCGDKGEVLHYSKMKTHLHNIESELTSALHFLRSKREEWTSLEVTRSANDLQKLSDAQEFQENEVMRALRRLRLIKAKLTIAEGKMALAKIVAKQKVRVKLKQVYGANKALQHLRTIHIVWHNPASEVFMAGSFDGWRMQRKMKKSRRGSFSVCLMLYPGRYEIKFIVDGMWKVDPLRPIVSTSGYENNLFIVA